MHAQTLKSCKLWRLWSGLNKNLVWPHPKSLKIFIPNLVDIIQCVPNREVTISRVMSLFKHNSQNTHFLQYFDNWYWYCLIKLTRDCVLVQLDFINTMWGQCYHRPITRLIKPDFIFPYLVMFLTTTNFFEKLYHFSDCNISGTDADISLKLAIYISCLSELSYNALNWCAHFLWAVFITIYILVHCCAPHFLMKILSCHILCFNSNVLLFQVSQMWLGA